MRRFGFSLLAAFSLLAVAFFGVLAFFAARAAGQGAAWGAWATVAASLLLVATFAWITIGAGKGMTAPPDWHYELPVGLKVLGGIAIAACVLVGIAVATGGGGGILP